MQLMIFSFKKFRFSLSPPTLNSRHRADAGTEECLVLLSFVWGSHVHVLVVIRLNILTVEVQQGERCTQSFTVTVRQFIHLCTPLDLRFPFSTIYSFPSLPHCFFFLCQKGHCCNSLSSGHLCKPGVSLLLEVVVEAPESVPVESVCQIFVKTFPVALQIV